MNREIINLDRGDKDHFTKSTCWKAIFEKLIHQPHSIGSIARSLNMEKSTVSARMNELKNASTIIYRGKNYYLKLWGKDKDPFSKVSVELWHAQPQASAQEKKAFIQGQMIF